MLIWVLTVLLVALFAAIGYGKGAVRMLFPLAGLYLGAMFAGPLGPVFKPLIKTTNPVYAWLLPPGVVFLTFAVVFIIIGFVVHRFVELHFKYKVDENGRLAFERLNRRLGACVGAIAGISYTVIIGIVVYMLGYLTVQVASGDNDTALLRYLNQARADLKTSGLERAAASFDPMPEKYYLASDVVGLIYNNASVHSRLANYPAFLSLSERQEFTDIASDTQYQQMLQSKGGLNAVINDGKTQNILNNQEIMDTLLAVDLKDLRKYLETGKSAKYEDLRICGRWTIDVPSVITQAKIQNPILATNAFALTQFKKFATNLLVGINIVASADNKLFLKSTGKPAAEKPAEGGDAAAAAPAPAAQPQRVAVAAPAPRPNQPAQMNSQLLQRYGLKRSPSTPSRGPAPAAPVAVAAAPRAPKAAPAANAPVFAMPTSLKFNGQGKWEGSGDEYELAVSDDAGKESKSKARIDNDRLMVSVTENVTLVFVRTQ